MNDLITWLRGVLDEDERWARAASKTYPYAQGAEPPESGAHWRWVAGAEWETVEPTLDEEFVAEPGHNCWLVTVEEWPVDYGRTMPFRYTESAVEVDSSAGGHIIRHDPASVLADIAAKRAILDLHSGEHQCPTDLRPIGHAAEPVWYGLPVGGGMKWCPTVRLLATAYADRPGYREEWRP